MARLELLEFARDFSKENSKNLTKDQEEFLKKFSQFLKDKEQRIFILRGYAGTGKTYLVSILTHFFEEKEFFIATPTGRAAKVVNDKIKENKASTIHSLIYRYDEVEEYDKNGEDDFKIKFELKSCETSNALFVFDEASMISNIFFDNFLRFGSGKLLTDILEFTLRQGNNKILFIGDEVQLPPIKSEESPALQRGAIIDISNKLKLEIKEPQKEQEITLTEITRQKDKDSAIIRAGEDLRKCLEEQNAFDLNAFINKFKNEKHFFTLSQSETIKEFASAFKENQKSVRYIVWKNEKATSVAKEIRAELQHKKPLEVGDELLVMKNTMQEGLDLYNGDFIKVLKLGEKEEKPVSFNVKGEKEPREIILNFIDAKIKTEKGEEIELKLLYDYFLFASGKGNRKDDKGETLDPLHNRSESKIKANSDTEQALYVEFKRRMEDEVKTLNLNGEEKKEALAQKMFENLRTDKYYNALRVKFAYVITCHKAQGGEWDKVFIDTSELPKGKEEKIKWLYTAITRAKKTCVFVKDED